MFTDFNFFTLSSETELFPVSDSSLPFKGYGDKGGRLDPGLFPFL